MLLKYVNGAKFFPNYCNFYNQYSQRNKPMITLDYKKETLRN